MMVYVNHPKNVRKSIEMKEVGNLLKESREGQGIDIRQAAKELKVRCEYLRILESGDVSSVSKEIYIIGYLRTYAKWLGLNSNEVVNRFKELNSDFSVSNTVTPETKPFFNVEEHMLKPGKLVLVACFALLLVSVVIFRGDTSSDVIEMIDVVGEHAQVASDSAVGNLSYKKEKDKKIMLIAKDKTEIKLHYSDSDIINKVLEVGEVYFFEDNREVLISSDEPKEVEVFSDDEKGKYLGTLEDFYMIN